MVADSGVGWSEIVSLHGNAVAAAAKPVYAIDSVGLYSSDGFFNSGLGSCAGPNEKYAFAHKPRTACAPGRVIKSWQFFLLE